MVMTNSTRALTTLLTAAALMLAAATSEAQDPSRRRPQQVPQTGAEDAAPPTPVELQGLRTLEAITSRSIEGLTFDRRPDGTLSIDLQGRFQNVLMAAPGQDGRLDISCHTGDHAHPAAAIRIQPWRPIKGGLVQPLDVSALRARLPRVTVAPTAPEKK
jgi:hypothetical protein